MEIAVVGATAAVTLAGGAVERAGVAITALAPTIRPVPEAAEALAGSDGGTDAGGRPGPRCCGSADLRRARFGRLPAGDGGKMWRGARSPWPARASGEPVPAPASNAVFGGAA